MPELMNAIPGAIPDIYPLDVGRGSVLYYDMQDMGATIRDHSGRGYHGLAQSPATGPPARVTGHSGYVRRFVAANAKFIYNTSFPKLAAATISVWFKVATAPQGANAGLVMMGATNTSWGLAIKSTGPDWYIMSRRSNGSTNQGINHQVYNATNYPAGWHHLVWTNDASTSNLYQNGALKNSSAVTVANSGANDALAVGRFGTYAGADSYFEGDIQIVGIYDYVMTAAEALEEYRHDAWRYGVRG